MTFDPDMMIVEAVAKATIIIRGTFKLNSEETTELIDVIYSKLVEIGTRRMDEDRVKQRGT